MTDGEARLAGFPFPLSGVRSATASGLDGDDLAWAFTMRMSYHYLADRLVSNRVPILA